MPVINSNVKTAFDCSGEKNIRIMRKTASHRVFGLSGYCTDPTEAEKKMRKAIGWGVQLQKRMVRRIKLERLLRSGVGTGKVEKLATKLALEMRGGRRGTFLQFCSLLFHFQRIIGS